MSDSLVTLLKAKFKLQAFRTGQLKIIESVLAGQDTLAVMPTGGGKSLCYQVPALAKPGMVLVVSPLIALMRDQVHALRTLGIPAGAIHSGQDFDEKRGVFAELHRSQHFILYVSPERVQSERFLTWFCAHHSRISLLAVDEAHCISQWGHDFREDYTRLATLRERAPNIPILGLTATATPRVLRDISSQLKLRNPEQHIHGFYRPNLYYQVSTCTDETQKLQWVEEAVKHFPEGRVLIYCGTRKQTEALSETLSRSFQSVGFYHAGLDVQERSRIQDDYHRGGIRILATTNAFGMGIDHPDVRLVVHYQIPANIESLYQEMGRAGRDGKDSTCLVLYAKKDRGLQSYFITQSTATATVTQARWNALDTLVHYSEVDECRHAGILTYFKDPMSRAMKLKACNHCDVCAPKSPRRVQLALDRLVAAEGGRAGRPFRVRKKNEKDSAVLSALQLECYESLKTWRKEWAAERDLPAFVVLGNRSLEDLARCVPHRIPRSLTALETIYGFGPKKIEHLGPAVLDVLKGFA